MMPPSERGETCGEVEMANTSADNEIGSGRAEVVDDPSPATLITRMKALWTYGIPAASIIGLLVYGLLRQLYAHFYGTLGASPEEVGLGYGETLALSGMAILWVLVLPPLLVVAGLRVVPSLRRGATVDHRVQQVAPLVAVLLVLIGIGLLVWGVWDVTGKAYDGQAVTSVNAGPLQVLGLRAEPATVWWLPDRIPADPSITSGECFLYLGQANGTTVLFDPGPPTVQTIRVQTADVVVNVVRAETPTVQTRRRNGVQCKSHRVEMSREKS